MIVQGRRIFLSCLILLVQSLTLFSQNDPYRAEIGVQTGINIYEGDVNSITNLGKFNSNLKNLQPDVGIMIRYRFNQRLALRLGYDYSSVKGNYAYAVGNETFTAKLNNSVHAFDLWGEFNFFDLENNPYKRFSKMQSPYIFAGIGNLVMPGYQDEKGRKYTLTIPFGIGYKVKFGQRWNFNVQITHRLLLGDDLEGKRAFDNPIPKTDFNPMNQDIFSGLTIGFSYDIWEKNCNCNENSFKKGSKPAPQKTSNTKSSKKEPKIKHTISKN